MANDEKIKDIEYYPINTLVEYKEDYGSWMVEMGYYDTNWPVKGERWRVTEHRSINNLVLEPMESGKKSFRTTAEALLDFTIKVTE